jgi:hypothetical protein
MNNPTICNHSNHYASKLLHRLGDRDYNSDYVQPPPTTFENIHLEAVSIRHGQPEERQEKPSIVPSALLDAIEESRFMRDLPEDWDDAGALPISVQRWEHATKLLQNTAVKIGPVLPVPHINPCANGSIDLYWNNPDFNLLINVPADANASGDFYGEFLTGERKGLILKGEFPSAVTDLSVVLGPFLAR